MNLRLKCRGIHWWAVAQISVHTNCTKVLPFLQEIYFVSKRLSHGRRHDRQRWTWRASAAIAVVSRALRWFRQMDTVQISRKLQGTPCKAGNRLSSWIECLSVRTGSEPLHCRRSEQTAPMSERVHGVRPPAGWTGGQSLRSTTSTSRVPSIWEGGEQNWVQIPSRRCFSWAPHRGTLADAQRDGQPRLNRHPLALYALPIVVHVC